MDCIHSIVPHRRLFNAHSEFVYCPMNCQQNVYNPFMRPMRFLYIAIGSLQSTLNSEFSKDVAVCSNRYDFCKFTWVRTSALQKQVLGWTVYILQFPINVQESHRAHEWLVYILQFPIGGSSMRIPSLYTAQWIANEFYVVLSGPPKGIEFRVQGSGIGSRVGFRVQGLEFIKLAPNG